LEQPGVPPRSSDILRRGLPLPGKTYCMVLVMFIYEVHKADVVYPIIAKIIVVDDMPILGEYFRKTDRSILPCRLLFKVKFTLRPDQGMF